jgi:hypothetical protein
VSIERGFSDSEPVGRQARARADRRDAHVGVMAHGTLACPQCDAPVAPGPRPLSPADPLACPLCLHLGPVRTFLSLAAPTRPARVQVRLRHRGAPAPR